MGLTRLMALDPTRILLARHGQTMTNREGRFCGHSETALTDLGRQQARALGERLANTRLDAVYTSGLGRAIETAAIALDGRAFTVRSDPALREIHYGDWEMEKERDVARRYPEQHRLMREENPAWQPPGGENIAIVRRRTAAAIRRIAREHPHQAVLVVSHGTAIQCMLAELLSIAPTHTFRLEVANCGLSEVLVRNHRFVLARLNETAHLGGIESPP